MMRIYGNITEHVRWLARYVRLPPECLESWHEKKTKDDIDARTHSPNSLLSPRETSCLVDTHRLNVFMDELRHATIPLLQQLLMDMGRGPRAILVSALDDFCTCLIDEHTEKDAFLFHGHIAAIGVSIVLEAAEFVGARRSCRSASAKLPPPSPRANATNPICWR